MKSRLSALAKVDNLYDNNCVGCPYISNEKKSYCMSECPVGVQLRKIGDYLLESCQVTENKILAKGMDMTMNEMSFLVNEKGIYHNRLAEAFGINRNTFRIAYQDLKKFIKDKEKAI